MLYSCTCVAILGVIGLSTLGVAYTYLFSSKTEFDSASYLCGYARLEPPLLIHPSGLIVWYGYPSPCSNNTHTESIFPSRRWFDISNACSWLNLEIGRGSPKHLRNRKKSRYGKNTEWEGRKNIKHHSHSSYPSDRVIRVMQLFCRSGMCENVDHKSLSLINPVIFQLWK